MNLYDQTCQHISRDLTRAYSTSFSTATQLLPANIRPHIYNIYGMVRVADEIVDTSHHPRRAAMLDEFEQRVYAALDDGYSSDVIAHAFQLTANKFGIGRDLAEPFFASMRQDVTVTRHTAKSLKAYIYGSAEVIGLMCLRVFYQNEPALYEAAKPQAQAMGAAYQKVNFLRDIGSDLHVLKRSYFPGVTASNFDTIRLKEILEDIKRDFELGKSGISLLPAAVQPSLRLSYSYYWQLYKRLASLAPEDILKDRGRVPDGQKLALFAQAKLQARLQK